MCQMLVPYHVLTLNADIENYLLVIPRRNHILRNCLIGACFLGSVSTEKFLFEESCLFEIQPEITQTISTFLKHCLGN